jgi:hypothetical protein
MSQASLRAVCETARVLTPVPPGSAAGRNVGGGCAKGGAASAYRSTNSGTASMGPGTRVRNVSRTGRHSSPVTPVCSFRYSIARSHRLSIPNIPRYLRSVWFPKRPRSSSSAKDRGVIPGFRMRINWSRAGIPAQRVGTFPTRTTCPGRTHSSVARQSGMTERRS